MGINCYLHLSCIFKVPYLFVETPPYSPTKALVDMNENEIVAQKITTNLDVRLRDRSGTNKGIILKEATR